MKRITTKDRLSTLNESIIWNLHSSFSFRLGSFIHQVWAVLVARKIPNGKRQQHSPHRDGHQSLKQNLVEDWHPKKRTDQLQSECVHFLDMPRREISSSHSDCFFWEVAWFLIEYFQNFDFAWNHVVWKWHKPKQDDCVEQCFLQWEWSIAMFWHVCNFPMALLWQVKVFILNVIAISAFEFAINCSFAFHEICFAIHSLNAFLVPSELSFSKRTRATSFKSGAMLSMFVRKAAVCSFAFRARRLMTIKFPLANVRPFWTARTSWTLLSFFVTQTQTVSVRADIACSSSSFVHVMDMVPTPRKWMPELCRMTQRIWSNNTDEEQEPNHNQNSYCVEQIFRVEKAQSLDFKAMFLEHRGQTVTISTFCVVLL